jgi:hypothetical protein
MLYTKIRGRGNLPLCLSSEAFRLEDVWGSGRIDLRFLDLGNSWRWVVRFTSLPLYPRGKSSRPHWIGSWMGLKGDLGDTEKWGSLTLPGLEFRNVGSPTRTQSLYRLFDIHRRNIINYFYTEEALTSPKPTCTVREGQRLVWAESTVQYSEWLWRSNGLCIVILFSFGTGMCTIQTSKKFWHKIITPPSFHCNLD